MRTVTILALALLLAGCAPNVTRPLVMTPLVLPPPEREVLLIDVPEDSSMGAGETTVWWTPKSGGGHVSFVAPTLQDKGLKRIDMLDAQNRLAGAIELGKRSDDGEIVGDVVLRGKGEIHFVMPHSGGQRVVSAKIDEELTDRQYQDLKEHGGDVRIQVDTAPGRRLSPMVRALGKKVELKWVETEQPRPANALTNVLLIGEATTLDKMSTAGTFGALEGKNIGSIQFSLVAKPGQRHRLTLTYR